MLAPAEYRPRLSASATRCRDDFFSWIVRSGCAPGPSPTTPACSPSSTNCRRSLPCGTASLIRLAAAGLIVSLYHPYPNGAPSDVRSAGPSIAAYRGLSPFMKSAVGAALHSLIVIRPGPAAGRLPAGGGEIVSATPPALMRMHAAAGRELRRLMPFLAPVTVAPGDPQ